jgi:hypothetical protein
MYNIGKGIENNYRVPHHEQIDGKTFKEKTQGRIFCCILKDNLSDFNIIYNQKNDNFLLESKIVDTLHIEFMHFTDVFVKQNTGKHIYICSVPDDATISSSCQFFVTNKIILSNMTKIDKNFNLFEWIYSLYKNFLRYNNFYDFCKDLAENEGNSAIINMNRKYLNQELCDLAFNKSGFYYLKDIPEKFRSYRMYLNGVKNYCELKDVPNKFKTYELCMIAIKKNNFRLKDIPKQYRKYDFILDKIMNSNHSLEFVEYDIKDLKMCLCAIKNDHNEIKFIPEKIKLSSEFLNNCILPTNIKNELISKKIFYDRTNTIEYNSCNIL